MCASEGLQENRVVAIEVRGEVVELQGIKVACLTQSVEDVLVVRLSAIRTRLNFDGADGDLFDLFVLDTHKVSAVALL